MNVLAIETSCDETAAAGVDYDDGTFAVLANVVFSPLASKLERNSAEELLTRSVYLLGTSSISRQENPRRLETQINTVLPPAKRVQFFD